MFEQDNISHHIERSILGFLTVNEYARFSEMRPKKVDTNLFAYHLKALLKAGYIIKTDSGYSLGRKGLVYVDRVNAERMKLRTQPKIITMLLVQDSKGRILLQKRLKQPYINTWTLPYGKLHIDDTSVSDAAIRESEEKLAYTPKLPHHVGDCYIVTRTKSDEHTADNVTIETRTLAHIVHIDTDDIATSENLMWLEASDIDQKRLAPAVKEIVDKATTDAGFFFEEYTVLAQ